MSDLDWYLVQNRPNGHDLAERNLHRQGFEVFLPRKQETRRVRGRFTDRLCPLFPGYLFVALDPQSGGWRRIDSTHGVSRIVRTGGRPAAVPEGIVEGLRQRCDAAGTLLPAAELRPGDRAVITAGPFVDFVARIESFAPGQRVWMLLELMGQQTRVAIDRDRLRAV